MRKDWSEIQLGDELVAKEAVPCIMEPSSCFKKGEVAAIGMLDEKRVGVWTKYDYIEYFWRKLEYAPDETTFIGTWFDIF